MTVLFVRIFVLSFLEVNFRSVVWRSVGLGGEVAFLSRCI